MQVADARIPGTFDFELVDSLLSENKRGTLLDKRNLEDGHMYIIQLEGNKDFEIFRGLMIEAGYICSVPFTMTEDYRLQRVQGTK